MVRIIANIAEVLEKHREWLAGYSDVEKAYLREAYLREAYLRGTYVENAIIMLLSPLVCPEEGAFIGWKKCKDNAIVKLLIPEDAKRSSAYGRKCRCSKAIVLEITGKNGKPLKKAKSQYDNEFEYRVGETVQPTKPFDEDRWNECASGIHFFITKQEAIDYM